MKPVRVGITHGDINGVGYEIILKALRPEGFTEICTPVIFGHKSIAEKCLEMLDAQEMSLHKIDDPSKIVDGKINLIELKEEMPPLEPGQITEKAGKSAVKALTEAIDALKNDEIDVLVTAPISKEAVQSESFNFPGHTEFLEKMADGNQKAVMILFEGDLRVALVTIHVPLTQIAEKITDEKITETVENFNEILKKDFGCERPVIAILSLNPHSGDGGLLGNEEKEIIEPAISALKAKGILAFGPFASDGFFGHGDYKKFDGVVAMYHDQGLAPFKTLAGDRGVNFTGGLPFVRTSPDHGTAFGIAWKGEADETSMREAIYSAIDIFRRRQRYEEASENPLKKYVNERPERGDRPEKKSDARDNNQKFEE